MTRTTVHCWFDPGCPFTWATSRWLLGAAERHDADIAWHVMSLAVLNEGKPVPEQYRAAMAASWRPARVLVAAEQAAGPTALGRLFTAIGEQVHDRGRGMDDDLLSGALAAAGLPEDLLRAADEDRYDVLVRESHAQGQARVGMDSGSPITAVGDGPAFFGPVVAPVPTGQAADDLWLALTALSRVPQLSELKRGRGALTA
jgi:2-hydroxychromene-2-carboxylate isomerase